MTLKLPFIFARRFVAGENFEQAAPKVKDLNNRNLTVTLDLLGENVNDRELAANTVDEYISLLQKIREYDLNSTISIKLTMMGLDISKEFAKENLFRLLDVAAEENQFVRIDMEGSDYTQVTLDIFNEAFEKYGKNVGIVIQSYLHRSKKDIEDLCSIDADVRLCKGAYSEPSDVALQKMPDIREAFKEQAALLMRKTSYSRIATHDDELINWTKTFAEEQDIGKDHFEFQMLYGLRLGTCERLVADGYNVRTYVPYGTMWVPYFTRRLRERKENIWFILSTMFKR